MPHFQAQDPAYEVRVRGCFEAQALMRTLAAVLTRVEPGTVEIAFEHRQEMTQQNGFLHAGIVTALIDSACGFAALSLMPADADVLSVEFKVNLLRPASSKHFLACGRVIKAGQTLTIAQGDLWALPHADAEADARSHVAMMQATMIRR
jgi:uncharacterized protein (TIGR00369 family)